MAENGKLEIRKSFETLIEEYDPNTGTETLGKKIFKKYNFFVVETLF